MTQSAATKRSDKSVLTWSHGRQQKIPEVLRHSARQLLSLVFRIVDYQSGAFIIQAVSGIRSIEADCSQTICILLRQPVIPQFPLKGKFCV